MPQRKSTARRPLQRKPPTEPQMAALAERPGSIRARHLAHRFSVGIAGHDAAFLSLRVLLDQSRLSCELEARLPISLTAFGCSLRRPLGPASANAPRHHSLIVRRIHKKFTSITTASRDGFSTHAAASGLRPLVGTTALWPRRRRSSSARTSVLELGSTSLVDKNSASNNNAAPRASNHDSTWDVAARDARMAPRMRSFGSTVYVRYEAWASS